MSKETGGPAFPEIGNVAHNSDWESESGMTLRDYLASKAMQGICAHNDTWGIASIQKIADEAYAMADAMLAARGSNS